MSFMKAVKSYLSVLSALCAGVIALTATAEAQGRRDYCERYAQDAVRLAEVNQRRNCGFEGPRWGDNYQAHFGWCMILPRLAEQEDEARKAQIKECRDERRDQRAGKEASCDTYAKLAVVQANANRTYECGYRGGEWIREERPHFRWCMRARRDFILDEIRYRAVELQKCFNKLGDYDEDELDREYQRRRF